ncbi:hypothetical protein MMC07_000564 [Pseudocyphellaria aurata]|nr:hypothetical protein [Pseudocyphellaria aurata]
MIFDLDLRAGSYLEPLLQIAVALWAFLVVVFETVTLRKSPGNLTVRDRVFRYTWLFVDSCLAECELEEGILPDLVRQASGIVVELGPGSGNQVSRYDASKVTKIFGIEPNVGLHDKLRVRVKESNLEDIYTIVPCGIENVPELAKYGIVHESVDTVLTCSVLCSVPQPEATVRHMYQLLKPGGKLIAYEHVRSDDFVSRIVQCASVPFSLWLNSLLKLLLAAISKMSPQNANSLMAHTDVYNLVWPYATGNCHLNRPTGRYLQDAGSWSKIDLEFPTREDASSLVPGISGQLIK